LGIHDEDLTVAVLSAQNTFKIECKLAKKGSYRYDKTTKEHRILVKCMRSRTLGVELQKRLAPRYGIDVLQLSIHNDQYRLGEFDIVITSLANAFYGTTSSKGFEWQPPATASEFLLQLGISPENQQQLAFEKMYFAFASDLLPHLSDSGTQAIQCSRQKCQQLGTDFSCGFIPNYPVITFADNQREPQPPWYPLEKIEHLLTVRQPNKPLNISQSEIGDDN
jgi:hypothetical protein